MVNDNEMTYGEHIDAKKKILFKEYDAEVKKILRNVTLLKEDISVDGFLSNHFFKHKYISDYKRLILKDLTVEYKKKYSDILDKLRQQ